jgi:DivIVA domain-containing protein
MDQDDPEQRIAELERQKAEGRRSTANAGGHLTAEQVHDVAFSKPPIGKVGYSEAEVDAFLDLIEQQVKSRRGASPPPPQAGPPRLPPTDRLPARHGGGPQTGFRRFIDGVAGAFGRIIDSAFRD